MLNSPSCLNPITFDQCDLPSRSFCICIEFLLVFALHICAFPQRWFSNPSRFCRVFFGTLNVEAPDLWYMLTPPLLICNPVLPAWIIPNIHRHHHHLQPKLILVSTASGVLFQADVLFSKENAKFWSTLPILANFVYFCTFSVLFTGSNNAVV